MADRALAQITGVLTTILSIEVPSFILSVTAAATDNTLNESNS
jgi:hypothetical protein